MLSEFESAFREMLRVIVTEVVQEIDSARAKESSPMRSSFENGLLLTSREAAKRLSISQRYLYTLTRSGVLPCVRIGQSVRYSVVTIQNWIRESEATAPPPPRIAKPNNFEKSKPARKAAPIAKTSSILRSKMASKPADAENPKQHTASPPKTKTRQTKQKVKQDNENKDRRNPFAELLAEVGIDRSSLPPLTNGELMRISETDIVTYHGWMYLNRPLPEEARERLKKHFLGIVSDTVQK
jgi:excisionase family DNA binding protein